MGGHQNNEQVSVHKLWHTSEVDSHLCISQPVVWCDRLPQFLCKKFSFDSKMTSISVRVWLNTNSIEWLSYRVFSSFR